MAGKSRDHNTKCRFIVIDSHSDDEHDDQTSRPSNNFNKRVTFKPMNLGGNRFRKSYDSKIDLVRKQLGSEFSNLIRQPRNNSNQRSFPEQNSSGHHNNFRNSPRILKKCHTGWYIVVVPNIENSDEVLKLIQTYIKPIVFYPYNKLYFGNALKFLVDDYEVAKALFKTSCKITQRDDRKLVIKVLCYIPKRGPISFTPVSSEVREKMMEVMATRYQPSSNSLDLSKFHASTLFTDNQLFVSLNRPAVLLAALNMVAQNTKYELYCLSLENNHIYLGEGLYWICRFFPGLKVLDLAGNKFDDLNELKCLSGYTIEVLNLSRNPVCDTEDNECSRREHLF